SGTTLVVSESLVDREIHLAALHDLARFNLMTRITERRKDAVLGLINQDVSVGEIQNAGAAILACSIPARRPELPTDLEGNGGLSGAGRHRDEYTCSAFDDRFDHAIDRDLLVVALAFSDCVIRRRQKALRGGVLAETAVGAITVPEFVWCGEILSNLFESRHEV